MKAISAIIVIILVLMIVVALAALSYTFFSGIFTSTTTTTEESIEKTTTSLLAQMKIEGASNNNIYVRNTGQTDISDLSVYIDDELVEVTMVPPTIGPGEVGTVNIEEFVGKREVDVKITTSQGSVTFTEKLEEMTFCDNPDVVLCLTFDEGSGTVAYDSSPSGNDGELKNYTGSCGGTACPVWVSGKYGHALEFDGIGDYVEVQHHESLNLSTDDFTMMAWFKAENDASIEQPDIIGKWYGTNPGYYFWVDNQGNLGIDFFNGNSTSIYSLEQVNDTTWHHGVVTRNGITFRLYLNGEIAGETSSVTTINADNTFTLHIGGDNLDNDYYFHGFIDEVIILNRSLTAAEIAEIYNSYNL
ncbi:MAG: hypothetical protein GTN36_00405 [Candidatus Aenigmarchaeota archaeon]|nr:hypothetical protein [Candidatus Aenigmarchaeota archaeon]